jgi:hypothetical protein
MQFLALNLVPGALQGHFLEHCKTESYREKMPNLG